MKKILFLGAGVLQSYAIQRARALGYYTIAIDDLANSVGFEHAHQRVKMSVNNIQGCLAIAQINQVDGIMNSYLDSAMITAARIVSEMDLPGITPQVADTIKNRFTLTSVLQQSNINSMEKIYLLSHMDELNDVMNFVHFPVLVKSLNNDGQEGLTKKANNVRELYHFFTLAQASSRTHQVLVEDYIEGHEYSVEAFVYNGEVQIYGVMEKIKAFKPEYVEIGYKTIAHIPNELEVRRLIKETIIALKIDFGSINIELITTQDNQHHIVKVKAGIGDSVIGTHIIPKVLRYNYIDNTIRASVNDPFDLPIIRYSKNVVTRKILLESDYQLSNERLSEYEKEHRVKLFYVDELKENYQDESIIEQSLYIIGAEHSQIVAEWNVNRVAALIMESSTDRKVLAYVDT